MFHHEIKLSEKIGTQPQNSCSREPHDFFGHLGFTKLYHTANKFDARAQPVLILHPDVATRHGVHVVFVGSDSKLHRTVVDSRGLQISSELVFQEERDGLLLRKFLGQQLTAQMESDKVRKVPAKDLTCAECKIEAGVCQRGRGRPSQHTFDRGC